ncbi:MAG: pitrilysin family protein [Planctomycetota bacterium]
MPDFAHATLDNGLDIIAEVEPNAESAAVGFFVRTGARDEQSEVMGVSHFLEHMMFKGTAARTAEQVNLEFDTMGAQYNAYTSNELTCFFASVLPDMLPRASALLADILRPALRDDDFTTEKNVILEEIAMYNDVPFSNLYETAMERHYAAHPLAHRVLGTTDTVSAMTSRQMRDYFDVRYSPDNMVVALSGSVEFDREVERLAELCSGWARTGAKRDHGEPIASGEQFELRDERVNRSYLLMITPAPAYDDDRRYAATLLARLLGDQDNSRLHWALIEKGLAEEAAAEFDGRDRSGDYYVYASCDPKRIDLVQSILNEEIAMLGQSITEADLDRLRQKLLTQITLGGERPGGRMQRLGRDWTYLRSHRTLEHELELIQAVTLDDLRSLLQAFPFEPRTVGRLLPAE